MFLIATDNHTCTSGDGMSMTAPYVLVDLHLKTLGVCWLRVCVCVRVRVRARVSVRV